MSEYYKLRRRKIADGMALAGFIIGFIVPAYNAGKLLVEGFETGLETRGLGYFVLNILVNALLGAVIGLVVGYAAAWLWERIHRAVRPAPADDATGNRGFSSAKNTPAPSGSAQLRPEGASPVESATSSVGAEAMLPPGITFDVGTVSAEEFASLIATADPSGDDIERLRDAMDRTTNIAARVGGDLVGAIRVLSDGYRFATITELIVHPSWRRRGIGRELMQRALDEAGTGVLLFGSPPDSSGFFERLGCQRAPTGYLFRRRAAAARIQTR